MESMVVTGQPGVTHLAQIISVVAANCQLWSWPLKWSVPSSFFVNEYPLSFTSEEKILS